LLRQKVGAAGIAWRGAAGRWQIHASAFIETARANYLNKLNRLLAPRSLQRVILAEAGQPNFGLERRAV